MNKSKIVKLKGKAFVPTGANKETFLLREFIHDRLYGEPDKSRNLPGGYFTQKNH